MKLNVLCPYHYDPKYMSWFGQAYFFGFTISALTVPPISEKRFGRKWAYLISMIIQTLAYIGIVLSGSYKLVIALYGIVGLCAGGRVVVGLAYLTEFIEVKH